MDSTMHGCNSHSMRCASSQSLHKSQCQSTKPIHPHDNLSSFTIKAKSSTNHAFVEKEKEKKKKTSSVIIHHHTELESFSFLS